MANLPHSFQRKKIRILDQLAVPDTEYDDLSPKGSVDAGIRDLIDEINRRDGLVTTSSCGGRVSIFLEGVRSSGDATDDRKEDEGVGDSSEKPAGVGGKGGGGRWLFVSHDKVELDQVGNSMARFLGMEESLEQASSLLSTPSRLIHFKFEPMVCLCISCTMNYPLVRHYRLRFSTRTRSPRLKLAFRSTFLTF